MKWLQKKIKSNKGDSNTVALLFVIMLLFMTTMTIIDIGFTFNNKNIIANAAQNGARITAIYGGVDDTAVAHKYGTTGTWGGCEQAGALNAVECSVYHEIMDGPGVGIVLALDSIDCGPGKTDLIGQRTYCTVKWRWDGLQGSALSFSRNRDNYFTTTMTAESEVISN